MEYVRMDFYTITGGMMMHSRVNNNSRKHIRHAISIIQLLSLIYKKKIVADNILRVRFESDVEESWKRFIYKAGWWGKLEKLRWRFYLVLRSKTQKNHKLCFFLRVSKKNSNIEFWKLQKKLFKELSEKAQILKSESFKKTLEKAQILKFESLKRALEKSSNLKIWKFQKSFRKSSNLKIWKFQKKISVFFYVWVFLFSENSLKCFNKFSQTIKKIKIPHIFCPSVKHFPQI